MASGIVYLILLAAFKSAIEHDVNHVQWVWRLLFGIGLVPAIITLYFRLVMKETKPYEQCLDHPSQKQVAMADDAQMLPRRLA